MFSLPKILLSKKAIALSPGVITIGEAGVAFTASEPIAALNAGAHVSINVSGVVPITDAMETIRTTEAAFPPGCICVSGVHPDGSPSKLTRQVIAYSSTGAFVQLFQEIGANREVKFFFNHHLGLPPHTSSVGHMVQLRQVKPNPSIERDVQGLSPLAASHVKR